LRTSRDRAVSSNGTPDEKWSVSRETDPPSSSGWRRYPRGPPVVVRRPLGVVRERDVQNALAVAREHAVCLLQLLELLHRALFARDVGVVSQTKLAERAFQAFAVGSFLRRARETRETKRSRRGTRDARERKCARKCSRSEIASASGIAR